MNVYVFTDQELISRLQNEEDHFVERKSSRDEKDWLKTAVAFANSAPLDLPCVLFIGVLRMGEIEQNVDIDQLQKKLNGKMKKAYPRIPYFCKAVENGGRHCLAVVIPGSTERPHFAGSSYIRVGSETFEASAAQFSELISQRSSKARKILEWKGKSIFVVVFGTDRAVKNKHDCIIEDCNEFYVTLARDSSRNSYPLNRVEMSFEDVSSRLKLEIRDVV